MRGSAALMWLGLALLVVAGALLAFTERAGTVWGTTLGIAGAGLVGWSWLRPKPGS
jgi:hypothetical protein